MVRKKLSAVLLSLALVMTMLPSLAFAENETTGDQQTVNAAAESMEAAPEELQEEELQVEEPQEEAIPEEEPQEEVIPEEEPQEEVIPEEEPQEEVIPEEEPQEEAIQEEEPQEEVIQEEPQTVVLPEQETQKEDQLGSTSSVSMSKLTVASRKTSSIKLSWTMTKNGNDYINAAGKGTFRLVVKKGDKEIKNVSITGYVKNIEKSGKKTNKYEYTAIGLSEYTNYTITIKYKPDGYSTISRTTDARTARKTVEDLIYTSATYNTVSLQWKLYKDGKVYKTNNKNRLSVYIVYDDERGEKKQNIAISFDSKTGKYSAKVRDLQSYKTYRFRVRYDKGSYRTKTVTTWSRIGNVKNFYTYSTSNAVILKWDKVENAEGYKVSWSCDSKSGSFDISGKTDALHPIPSGCKDKTITYKIIAKGGTKRGESATPATKQGAAVRTMHMTTTLITDRVKKSTNNDNRLKCHCCSSPVPQSFKKGFTVHAIGYIDAKYIFEYNGHIYHIRRTDTSGAYVSMSDYGREYSKTEAEHFVNRRGLTSNTGYLIWVNTYSQKLYVFEGSKGNWKLYKGPWQVATGQAKTPTDTGQTRVRSKSVGCHDPFPQTPWWCVCSNFSIHGKAPYYPAMGKPASHGCVRNWSDNAKWMYYNIPVNTAVYVF